MALETAIMLNRKTWSNSCSPSRRYEHAASDATSRHLSRRIRRQRDWVQTMFKLGDQLRAESCQEFDRRYAPKKPPPGI